MDPRSLCTSERWSHHESELLAPYTYVCLLPSKGIRNGMLHAFNTWLAVPEDQLKIIMELVDMLHNASLIVDDIQDGSPLRRGQPAAHVLFGLPRALSAANYVYFKALETLKVLSAMLPKDGAKQVEMIMLGELLALHQGQGMDIVWRDTRSCPSEDEYIAMAKTGGLFRIGVRVMIACATRTTCEDDLISLVNLMGVFFQIRDDYMNLQCETYTSQKGFAEDLSEGKYSYPLIHALRANIWGSSALSFLINRRPSNSLAKIAIILYLKHRSGSLEYTREALVSLQHQVTKEVTLLGGNAKLMSLLGKLAF